MKNIHVLPTDKPSKLIKNNLGYGITPTQFSQTELHFIQAKFQNTYITSDKEIKEGDWMYYKHFGEDIVTKYDTMGGQNTNVNEHKDYYKKIILTTDQDLIKDGVQAIDDEFLEWFVNNPGCEEVEVLRCPIEGLYTIIPKEEPKQIYYNTVGRENGEFVIKGQFNTQKEALDLANELNKKFPDLYYDWKETLIKEEPKPVWKQIIETCGGEEEFMKSAGLLPKQETLEEVELAILFHNTYERLAPSFGYETRVDTKLFETTTSNGMLMIAVCKEIIKWQQERSYSEEEVLYLLLKFQREYVYANNETGLRYWFEQFKKK